MPIEKTEQPRALGSHRTPARCQSGQNFGGNKRPWLGGWPPCATGRGV